VLLVLELVLVLVEDVLLEVLVDEVLLEVLVDEVLLDVEVLVEDVLLEVLVLVELLELEVEVVLEVDTVVEVELLLETLDVEVDMNVVVEVSIELLVVDELVVVVVSGGAVLEVVVVSGVVLVVVPSLHHATSGSSCVASPMQTAAAAESSAITRSMVPTTRRQERTSTLLIAATSGKLSSPEMTTSLADVEQVGKAGMALFSASASCSWVKSSQQGQSSSGSTMVVLVVLLVEVELLLDVVDEVEVVVVVVVSGAAVEVVVSGTEVEVVDSCAVEVVEPAPHQVISGAMSVASVRQTAAAAESRRMSRSMLPVTRLQALPSLLFAARSLGLSSASDSKTSVAETEQVGNAGMALFSAAASCSGVKSSQRGQSRRGEPVVVVVEVDVVLLVDDEVVVPRMVVEVIVVDVLVVVLVDEVVTGTVEVVVGRTSEQLSDTPRPVEMRRAHSEPTKDAPLPMRAVAFGALTKPWRRAFGASRTRLPSTLIWGGTVPSEAARLAPFSSVSSSTTLSVDCAPDSTVIVALRPALSEQI